MDAIRQYVSTAAAGISLGAALMAVVPVEIMRVVGLENADQMVAAKITFVAALVWLAARSSINIRWK
jgi:hypothetical protein